MALDTAVPEANTPPTAANSAVWPVDITHTFVRAFFLCLVLLRAKTPWKNKKYKTKRQESPEIHNALTSNDTQALGANSERRRAL